MKCTIQFYFFFSYNSLGSISQYHIRIYVSRFNLSFSCFYINLLVKYGWMYLRTILGKIIEIKIRVHFFQLNGNYKNNEWRDEQKGLKIKKISNVKKLQIIYYFFCEKNIKIKLKSDILSTKWTSWVTTYLKALLLWIIDIRHHWNT